MNLVTILNFGLCSGSDLGSGAVGHSQWSGHEPACVHYWIWHAQSSSRTPYPTQRLPPIPQWSVHCWCSCHLQGACSHPPLSLWGSPRCSPCCTPGSIFNDGRVTLRNRKFLRKYIPVYPNPAPVDDFQRPYGHGPAFQLNSPPGNGLPMADPEPQLQRRHLTGMPWPLTPLSHRPRYSPSHQLQLHLYCHPLHCRAPVTSHLVHQMVPLRMPLPPRMVLAVMIPVWPHTLNYIPLMSPECWHGCRPTTIQARERAAYPIPLPSVRDTHRDSPTPSQISPH